MFVLSSMRSDCYVDGIHMFARAAMVCVLMVKSVRHFKGITRSYRGLQWVLRENQGLQAVTKHYHGLQWNRRGYWAFKRVIGAYKG